MTPRICAFTFAAPFTSLAHIHGFLTEAEAVDHAGWLNAHGTAATVVVGVHSHDELVAELAHQRDRHAAEMSA